MLARGSIGPAGDERPADVVLVHGLYHGSWCWRDVVAGLEEAGVRTFAVDLPRRRAATDGDLAAAALTSLLDGLDRVILAGHSAGGREITLCGGHRAVHHLVYLAATMPAAGESLREFGIRAFEAPSLLHEAVSLQDGHLVVDPARAADLFYDDCPQETIRWAMERLRGERFLAGLADSVEAQAWRYKPSTYIICGRDRALLPAIQRGLAARATYVEEWPTAHSPFLSDPRRVVEMLSKLAAGGSAFATPWDALLSRISRAQQTGVTAALTSFEKCLASDSSPPAQRSKRRTRWQRPHRLSGTVLLSRIFETCELGLSR